MRAIKYAFTIIGHLKFPHDVARRRAILPPMPARCTERATRRHDDFRAIWRPHFVVTLMAIYHASHHRKAEGEPSSQLESPICRSISSPHVVLARRCSIHDARLLISFTTRHFIWYLSPPYGAASTSLRPAEMSARSVTSWHREDTLTRRIDTLAMSSAIATVEH